MFKLEEVSKTYKLSGGAVVHALDGISLTLPDKGMVFVVGKSGSGKSTFLNILGGLDKPSSGDVSFNGNRFSTFKDKQFSNYRNNVIGFIFQEFNLLDSMTVSENIAVPLSLQSVKEKGKRVAEALRKVELEGYEKRKTNQLSGGEKQRVAIARALVKEPKLILADEPTGNLDSETSGTVFKLLKKLSRDYLVVVVTHDLESAKAYSDYMVGLSDGKVLFNTCPATEEHSEPLKDYKTSLPFTVSLKMGVGNLLKKPVRSVMIILMIMLTVFCITMAQVFFTYSPAQTHARLLQESGLTFFELVSNKSDETEQPIIGLPDQKVVTQQQILALKEEYPDMVFLPCIGKLSWLCESGEDLTAFGFEFLGEYTELDSQSKYLTYDVVQKAYDSGRYLIKNDDGDYVMLRKSEYPIDVLAGRELIDGSGQMFVLAGIVKLDTVLNVNEYKEIYGQRDVPESFFRTDFKDFTDPPTIASLAVKVSSMKNLKSFFEEVPRYGFYVSSPLTLYLNYLQPKFMDTQSIFAVLGALLFVIMFILVVNLISGGILSRKKEIGILKALGAKNGNIWTMFLIESLIIACVTFILGMLLYLPALNVLNKAFALSDKLPLQLFIVNFWGPFTLAAATIGLVLSATILPLLRINKMTPISAVKSI